MKTKFSCILFLITVINSFAQKPEYLFQNSELQVEECITNLLSVMTLNEKVKALSTDPSIPRLGVKVTGHVEGLHGLACFYIKNTGKRDGEEVVQLYIKHLNSKIQRPIKELKCFKRLFINAGETILVSLTLKAKDLEYWNTNKQRFELEKEQIKLQVGSASGKILLTKI